MSIRKAVLPVAGLGTRVLPASKVIPKEMLPLVDKPTLQYIVEEAVAAAEMHEEESGLRGRIGSLIGRDLNERDGLAQRQEPPLRNASMPRIEPSDRTAHSGELAPLHASVRLPREDLRKLQAALHELAECRKLLGTNPQRH